MFSFLGSNCSEALFGLKTDKSGDQSDQDRGKVNVSEGLNMSEYSRTS